MSRCAVGKANPVPGSSSASVCLDCLPGSFAAATGRSTCELSARVDPNRACAALLRADERARLESHMQLSCRQIREHFWRDGVRRLHAGLLLHPRLERAAAVPRRDEEGRVAQRDDK